jgi:dTMP kinase
MHIAFEGIDGSGKTTQFKTQGHRLRQERGDEEVGLCKFNNTNNFFGRLVRNAYNNNSQSFVNRIVKIDLVRETLCAFSARTNVCKNPEVAKTIIFTDRSVVTAFAYNYQKIPEKYLSFIEPSFYPDAIIFLDVDPEVGLRRINSREGKMSYSKEKREIFEQRYQGYQEVLYKKRPKVLKEMHVASINASQSLEKVTDETYLIIKDLIGT